MLNENLLTLRKMRKLSQEQVAEEVGVSRQAYAKWESGETTPDVTACMELAKFYDVSLDELVNHSQKSHGMPLPPKGKHLFGVVTVGDKGQIVIPKKARKVFGIESGDRLVVLGDEGQGIAMIKESDMLDFMRVMGDMSKRGE